MALVLCTGINAVLLETRRMILESAGHKVITVTSEPELRSACQNLVFDVAVIGQTVSTRMKRRILLMIREQCPEVKVLELYEPHTGRVLDDADSSLLVPADIPKDLADRVTELAGNKSTTPD
jgi:hypothetical protein